MASYFVDGTVGSGANAGTSFSAPLQTVTQALAAAVTAGDTSPTIACGSTGAYTAGAGITWTPPTNGKVAIVSAINPGSGTTITPAAGASEAVGAAAAAFFIANTSGASIFVSGMTMVAGTSTNSVCVHNYLTTTGYAPSKLEMLGCTISSPAGTLSAPLVNLANGGSGAAEGTIIKLINCTFIAGARSGSTVSVALRFGVGLFEVVNPTFTLSTGMLALFGTAANAGNYFSATVRDGDISSFTGTGIVYVGTFAGGALLLANLKISATPTLLTGAWPAFSGSVTFRNVDSGNTIYTLVYADPYGTLSANESVYAASGATFSGSGVSWKVVTSSNANAYTPFVLPPLSIWAATLTAQTSMIQIAQASGATALTNQQIWSDLDYSASALYPNYSWENNRNAAPITGTPANQPTSAVSWTGLSTPVTQQLQNAFTAAAAGLLQSRISIGIASTTLYIDPFIGGVT